MWSLRIMVRMFTMAARNPHSRVLNCSKVPSVLCSRSTLPSHGVSVMMMLRGLLFRSPLGSCFSMGRCEFVINAQNCRCERQELSSREHSIRRDVVLWRNQERSKSQRNRSDKRCDRDGFFYYSTVLHESILKYSQRLKISTLEDETRLTDISQSTLPSRK